MPTQRRRPPDPSTNRNSGLEFAPARTLRGRRSNGRRPYRSDLLSVQASKPEDSISVSTSTAHEDREKVLACWENENHAYNLFSFFYGHIFGLLAFSKTLDLSRVFLRRKSNDGIRSKDQRSPPLDRQPRRPTRTPIDFPIGRYAVEPLELSRLSPRKMLFAHFV